MSSIRERIDMMKYTFHVSQSELARRIGVSPQLISQIVNGKIHISYLTAKALESEFGVNAEWVINGTGEMMTRRENKAKELNLNPELVAALKSYPGIVSVINDLASRMTLQDWEALNAFLTRGKQEEKAEEGDPE